jgi:hypothetical protein
VHLTNPIKKKLNYFYLLPACLFQSRDFAFAGKFPQTEAANFKFPVNRMAPAANLAPRISPCPEFRLFVTFIYQSFR